MTEEKINEAVEASAETAQEPRDAQDKSESVVDTQALKQRDQDRNWSQARAVMSAQQTKIQELESKLSQLAEQKQEIEEKLDPDDYATIQHVDKLAERKVSKKAAELQRKIEDLEKKLYEADQTKLENEMRSKYEDYDYVIENFAVPMIQKNKALAEALRASQDPYATAYRLAKASEEYEKEMTKQEKPNPKAEKIIKNTNRPLSAQAAGGSLKSQSDYFSNLTPAQVWEASQKYAKRA